MEAFRSCKQKAFRTYFQHWKSKHESVHLVAGSAYAKGLEVARTAYYDDGRSPEDSVALGLGALIQAYGSFQCPPDSGKSLERTAGALEFYFSMYPLETDTAKPLLLPSGKHAIEFSFAEPIVEVMHPVSGEPLIYTGRSDMIAEFAGGVYVEDDKTTSQLGASWGQQWDLRSQFLGYNWAARKTGIRTQGTLVRGVSILKTKYDTQQALPTFADWEIDRWYKQLIRDLEVMKRSWAEGYWDYNLGHACTEYGGCSLRRICKSADPETWLKMDFEQRIWDPLAREERYLDGRLVKEAHTYQPLPMTGLKAPTTIGIDTVF